MFIILDGLFKSDIYIIWANLAPKSTENQWKVTNDSRTLNKGELLVLSEQRTAVTSAFIFVVYSPMCRYYRKWYSSYIKAWHAFVNEHQLFSLVSIENCNVVVLPENLSLAWVSAWSRFEKGYFFSDLGRQVIFLQPAFSNFYHITRSEQTLNVSSYIFLNKQMQNQQTKYI